MGYLHSAQCKLAAKVKIVYIIDKEANNKTVCYFMLHNTRNTT